MLRYKELYKALAFTASLAISNSFSADFSIGASVGVSQPQNSNYENGSFGSLSAGYQTNAIQLQIGYMYLGEFDLKNDDPNASIESRGPFLEIAKIFKFETFHLEPTIGLAQIKSKANLSGFQVGENEDTAPFLKLRVVKELTDGIALQSSMTYFNDISGSDVAAIDVGLRFSFN
ncbi:hypothetical protein [Teredinibacter haidensis]|uniref:hypothetical protein n=1 Tax=Teredinibacter haidensis TaxID=2731755 RepID=UPI000948A3CE|nr:hypothetical protein [Teredinibacter haidensis]